MPDVKGRIDAIKKRLITHIEAAMYNTGMVTPNWDKVKTTDLKYRLPVISVRVNNLTDNEAAYGRLISGSSKGHMRHYYFNAHIIASACKEVGEADEARYAHQHADAILSYYRSLRKSTTERSISGIWDFSDMQARESSMNSDALVRVIIDGVVEVQYLDSP